MIYIFSLFTLFAFQISPAFAYLDPGAGSFVLQMIVAGGLAVTAAVKVYWFKIKNFVQKIILHKEFDEK